MTEYEAVISYLKSKTYSDECSKDKKRIIRKQAVSFKLVDGILHHIGKETVGKVVCDAIEKRRIIESLHNDPVGGSHFGVTVTTQKLKERYWWKGFTEDVKTFVRSCERCQKANPANTPAPAILHPIKVCIIISTKNLN